MMKHFTFNLRVTYYCDYKPISTYTFASVYIFKTKWD